MRLYLNSELESKGGSAALHYDGNQVKMSFGTLGDHKVAHVDLTEFDLTVVGDGEFNKWARDWYRRGGKAGFDQELASTLILLRVLEYFQSCPNTLPFRVFLRNIKRTAEEAGREKQRMLVRQQWNELLKALE